MNTISIHPLKFKSILVKKIWGGRRIPQLLGKGTHLEGEIGESWEISGVKGFVSVVAEGLLAGKDLNWIIERHGSSLLGKHYQGINTEFPLLIKFLDANADLSVQVHPNDAQAKETGAKRGKTEMWYIMKSSEDAYIYNGFNKKLNASEFKQAIDKGKTIDVLNKIEVKRGDSFFVPAGRIHSIGSGTFLAEIQQSSDITYRIYDFDRTDKNGNVRDLHIDASLKVLNYDLLKSAKVDERRISKSKSNLVESPFFTTNSIKIKQPYFETNSNNNFKILICVEGNSLLHTDGYKTVFNMGDCILIPASCTSFFILPDRNGVEYLETIID